jgi:hypothetical protein
MYTTQSTVLRLYSISTTFQIPSRTTNSLDRQLQEVKIRFQSLSNETVHGYHS